VQIPAKLPAQLAECEQVFKDFYLSKYNGRRLQWQNELGHCSVKANFNKARKELSVSLFQTIVLVLFNEVEQMNFSELLDATGIGITK